MNANCSTLSNLHFSKRVEVFFFLANHDLCMGLNFVKNKVELQEISEDTKGLIDVNRRKPLVAIGCW